jgi:hypothetical protein
MKKEEFKQKTRDLLNELTDSIIKLEDKAGDVTDDAKVEYRKQLDNLRGIRDNLASKMEEYENIADSKWDVVRESAGNFFASVAESWKENLGKVTDAFKKDEK